jgi:hypothetical protein
MKNEMLLNEDRGDGWGWMQRANADEGRTTFGVAATPQRRSLYKNSLDSRAWSVMELDSVDRGSEERLAPRFFIIY